MLRRIVGTFDRAAAVFACMLVAALLVCVSLGVITRTLGDPYIWTDELSRFLMVWLAVFGWILASRRRLQVRIRYFQNLLPARGRKVAELAIQLAVTTFGALICGYGVGLIARNHDLEATSMPISMAWIYAPIVLAGLATALQGAREVVGVLIDRAAPAPSGPGTTAE